LPTSSYPRCGINLVAIWRKRRAIQSRLKGTLPAAWRHRLSIENLARADDISCRPVNSNALPVPTPGLFSRGTLDRCSGRLISTTGTTYRSARQLRLNVGSFKRSRQCLRCRGQSGKPIHASRWRLLEQCAVDPLEAVEKQRISALMHNKSRLDQRLMSGR
jgi:hypothetical protein